jgi:hypothetical protein
MDPLSFIRYLQTLGKINEVIITMPTLPRIEDMDPEDCYLNFKIAFSSSADKKTIEDVFEFAEDDCDITILPPNSRQEHYLQLLADLPEDQVKRLGEMLIEIGALTEKKSHTHSMNSVPKITPGPSLSAKCWSIKISCSSLL